ncbi:hypothetical protein ACIRVK_00765 [Streptomyces sp. NPDC101152]
MALLGKGGAALGDWALSREQGARTTVRTSDPDELEKLLVGSAVKVEEV